MFKQKELPYEFSALEPYIDKKTMEIHYTKHHAGYVKNLNEALESYDDLQNLSIEDLITSMDSIPEDIKTTVRNNGGGHHNHTLFWEAMTPNKKQKKSEVIDQLLESNFGSFSTFVEMFSTSALKHFGSGWAWLVKSDEQIEIIATPNQDSPLMLGKTPLLGLDVWEHAYYLKYQNKRAEYIENWWNVVDWKVVESRYGAS